MDGNFSRLRHNKRINSVNNVFYVSAFTNRDAALSFVLAPLHVPFSDSPKKVFDNKTNFIFAPITIQPR